MSAAANQTADRVLAAASLACLALVAVSLALWRRAIHRSICVVKEAAYAVWFLPQLLLCPIPTMAALVTIACCAVAAVLLLTAWTIAQYANFEHVNELGGLATYTGEVCID